MYETVVAACFKAVLETDFLNLDTLGICNGHHVPGGHHAQAYMLILAILAVAAPNFSGISRYRHDTSLKVPPRHFDLAAASYHELLGMVVGEVEEVKSIYSTEDSKASRGVTITSWLAV